LKAPLRRSRGRCDRQQPAGGEYFECHQQDRAGKPAHYRILIPHRSSASALLLEHDLLRKPVPTFGIMLVPLEKPLRLPEVPGAES
jgi:hypothetical protein